MPSIEQWMIDVYSDNVRHSLQQKSSLLEGAVMVDYDMKGKKKRYDFIGTAELDQRLSRNAKTKYTDDTFYNRWVTASPFDRASLVDRDDIVALMQDPTSKIVETNVMAAKRTKDRIIISAFDAVSYTGEDATTAVVFPTEQIVNIQTGGGGSNTGLNLEKLMTARKILKKNEVNEEDPLFCLITPEQEMELLKTTEIKSSDYNTVKALVQGEIDTYLGFKFIRSNMPVKDSSNIRSLFAWTKSAMQLAVAKDIEIKVSELPEFNYDWQVWVNLFIGAVRLYDKLVVKLPCQE